MILHTKDEHINVNDNLETYIKKQNKKYTLKKIAAALSVAGAIFLLKSCGTERFTEPLPTPVEISDELQNSPLSKDVKDKYLSAYSFFYNLENSDGLDVRTAVITEYVNSSRTITTSNKNLLKDEIRETTGVEGEITFKLDKIDGDCYVTGAIYLGEKDLPKEWIEVICEIISSEGYKGTGESDAWKKQVDNYSKLTNDIIKHTNEIVDAEYEYQDGKIVQVQKQH